MMHVKKRIWLLCLAALSLFLVFKIAFNPYARISRYVNQNEGNLRASCEFYLNQKYVNKADTEIDVMGIYGGDNKIVQFFYSGKGIAPASVYYGFYYSPEDVAVPYCNVDYELNVVREGVWTWDGGGDNGGKIRKIRDNWYYYEAWF